ncbi:MAG TPA: hypothetical protein ENK20_00085, partial [Chromatiales bacterium]|nr:hypothetical protein [Chromatiales bacterium]
MNWHKFNRWLLEFEQDEARRRYVEGCRQFRKLLDAWLKCASGADSEDGVGIRLFDTLTMIGNGNVPFSEVTSDLRRAAAQRLAETLGRHRDTLRRLNHGTADHALEDDFALLGTDVVRALSNALDTPEIGLPFLSQAMMLLTGQSISITRSVRDGLRHLGDGVFEEADRLCTQTVLSSDTEGVRKQLVELLRLSRTVVEKMPVPRHDLLLESWRGDEPARLCDCVLQRLSDFVPARHYLRQYHREPVPRWLDELDLSTSWEPGTPDRAVPPPALFYGGPASDGAGPGRPQAPDAPAPSSRHDRRALVERFFASRTVFYPGSGLDGHSVELFGSAHACHCFVQVDYSVTRERLHEELQSPGFRGYRVAAVVGLSAGDLVPGGWTPHLLPDEHREVDYRHTDPGKAFADLVLLERLAGYGDDHGARRLAVLFLYADAVAAYDALYCQAARGGRPPFAILLQDHGLDG